MSFALMAILNYDTYDLIIRTGVGISSEDREGADGDDYGGGGGVNSPTTEFFQKASLVLFDLPDFCCTSAYVLLLVVWAEAILAARRHWLSSISFRRLWLQCFVIFNILLYAVQVSLYSLLFIPSIDQAALTSLIYLTLTTINLALPLLWLCFYFYLSILFSGFPYSSIQAQTRLSSLTRQGCVWTSTRILWGLIALTSLLRGWITPAASTTPGGIFYCIVVILVFYLVEILPIFLSLQESMLSSLAGQSYVQLEKDTNNTPSPSNDIDELEMQSALQNESFQMHLQRIQFPSSLSLQSIGSHNSHPDNNSLGLGEDYAFDDDFDRLRADSSTTYWEEENPSSYQTYQYDDGSVKEEDNKDTDQVKNESREDEEYSNDYSRDDHSSTFISKWWRGVR